MKRDDDKELWDLLGKSDPATLSPFFARNVVRAVRTRRTWRAVAADYLTVRQAIAIGVLLVVLPLAPVLMRRGQPQPECVDDVPEAIAQIDPDDYEVVADLDELIAMRDDELWNDTDSGTP